MYICICIYIYIHLYRCGGLGFKLIDFDRLCSHFFGPYGSETCGVQVVFYMSVVNCRDTSGLKAHRI